MTSMQTTIKNRIAIKKTRKQALEEDDTSTTTRRGPKPRTNSYSVSHLLSDKESYFYLMKYGKTDVHKGGWSSCVEKRLAEINDTARKSLAKRFPETHCLFDIIFTKKFECQQDAYDYEQEFFREIEVEEFVKRLDGEYYDIPADTVNRILEKR